MTGMALVRASSITGESSEVPHVLSGVVLNGVARRLAGMLDREFLDEAGWDPGSSRKGTESRGCCHIC